MFFDCKAKGDLSSLTRDGTHTPCSGRWKLNPCTTREALSHRWVELLSTFYFCLIPAHWLHEAHSQQQQGLLRYLRLCRWWAERTNGGERAKHEKETKKDDRNESGRELGGMKLQAAIKELPFARKKSTSSFVRWGEEVLRLLGSLQVCWWNVGKFLSGDLNFP